MIVCICNQVTESQIRSAVNEGHHSVERLQEQFAVCDTCCTCLNKLSSIIDQAQIEQNTTAMAANHSLAYAAM